VSSIARRAGTSNESMASACSRLRKYSNKAMPKTFKKSPTADQTAEMASRGEDVSAYFTNQFTVVKPVYRVNVDLSQGMLRELDERAARLNISRQAVIKTLLGRALSQERENKPRSRKAS
jgi:hypothetical protein